MKKIKKENNLRKDIEKAIFETFTDILENQDIIDIEYNYCGKHIVDIIVADCHTNAKKIYHAFNLNTRVFPYY